MNTIESALRGISYPGCGLIVGKLGGLALAAYFITGRDDATRGFLLAEEGDTLSTYSNKNARSDSNNALYTALRVCGGIVVSSGDQTDTICSSLTAGRSFQYALSARCYEPDEPVFTPRIAGMILPTGRCTIGIVKKADGAPDCRRKYWSYDPREGEGFLIHAYGRDGDIPPAFDAEPKEVRLNGSPEELAEQIWRALDEKNRVSLYVRCTDLFTGRFTSAIRTAASRK